MSVFRAKCADAGATDLPTISERIDLKNRSQWDVPRQDFCLPFSQLSNLNATTS